MNVFRSICFSVLLSLVLLSSPSILAQGALTPPGAPSATMKTLEQIEPRIDVATLPGDVTHLHVISEPGSYYLSENIEVGLQSGINIHSPDVTLDLNGFQIVSVSGNGGYGIYIGDWMDRTTVRNGSIAGFQFGIYSRYADGCLLEKLAVSGCTDSGIFAGAAVRMADCRAQGNTGSGIVAGHGSSLSGCTAHDNQGDYGVFVGNGSALSDCTAYDNTVNYAIYAGSGSAVNDCVARYNEANYGIYVGSGSVMRGCSAYDNQGSGSSSYGIYAYNGSVVVNCSSSNNDHAEGTTTALQGTGIFAGSRSVIEGCAVSYNQGDGIRVSVDSSVRGNTCDSNGYSGDGAGIHATSSDTRIDDNNVTGNDRGIEVDYSGNFITRNTASGNTLNWDIASGNVCYVVQAVTAGAISGNSGGSSPGTTNPNANFTY